jgi:hypothetical protein
MTYIRHEIGHEKVVSVKVKKGSKEISGNSGADDREVGGGQHWSKENCLGSGKWVGNIDSV